MKNTTQQPLKRKWTSPVDTVGNLIWLKWVKEQEKVVCDLK